LAKEHGTKVLLEGQGADELLGGYHGYSHARIRSLLEQGKYAKLLSFLKAWGDWPGRSFGNGLMQLGSILLPDALHPLARKLSGRSPRPKWMNDHLLEKEGLSFSRPQADLSDEASARRLSEALRNALTGKGLSALLRHSDRNSMRWSIESRVPFLTTDLAEFLLGLPEDYLVSGKGETKSVFRLAMKGIVPDTVLKRRDKVGFSTPERQWLASLEKKPLSWLEGLKSIPFVDFDSSLKAFRESLDENRPLTFEAWRLMNLGRWMQVHGHAA
jgi:asparagine synthase (glutamine-hydrolysing)